MKKVGKKNSIRAPHFKETRANRHLEIAEDYTELIADIIDDQGHVQVCDIAREMGISHVSVLRTIKRLVRDGFLAKEDTGTIELTPKGKEMAIFSKKKHLVLTEFLLNLGIPEHIASTDVEGIEHHISPMTLQAIETHMRRLFPKKEDQNGDNALPFT